MLSMVAAAGQFQGRATSTTSGLCQVPRDGERWGSRAGPLQSPSHAAVTSPHDAASPHQLCPAELQVLWGPPNIPRQQREQSSGEDVVMGSSSSCPHPCHRGANGSITGAAAPLPEPVSLGWAHSAVPMGLSWHQPHSSTEGEAPVLGSQLRSPALSPSQLSPQPLRWICPSGSPPPSRVRPTDFPAYFFPCLPSLNLLLTRGHERKEGGLSVT